MYRGRVDLSAATSANWTSRVPASQAGFARVLHQPQVSVVDGDHHVFLVIACNRVRRGVDNLAAAQHRGQRESN